MPLIQKLSRRAALIAVGGAVLGGYGVRAAGRNFSPEMFGAAGNGRTDDYAAFVRMAQAVSQVGGGTVIFGKRRRYRLDQVHNTGPRANNLPVIEFIGCSGLTIDLNGSTVDVKGDFHRGADLREGRFSYLRAVEALVFTDCSDLAVGNGFMNGNADRMTRDPTVWESSGRGILLKGCSRVGLEDLHIHHFPTDGVGINPIRSQGRASRDITLNRVRLTNNARMGLTNAGGLNVVAADCEFSANGNTGGPYFHYPGAGVDLEPNRRLDVRSDFRAMRCRFDNNRGHALIAGSPELESFVELIDCSGTTPAARMLLLTAERSLIRGGVWHNIQIACAFGARRRFPTGISVEVTGGTYSGDNPQWSPIRDLNRNRPNVYIHDNRFELRAQSPYTRRSLFQCANPNHRFESNRIFVDASGHHGVGDQIVGQFAGASVHGNHWSTDLRPPRRFVNNYRGARVTGETFSGAFGAEELRGVR